jgi:frataxin-like iron-binding protein CyaY
MKPTLEKVKEHFKNAKEVKCISSNQIYDLTKITIIKDIHMWIDDFWIDADIDDRNIKLTLDEQYAEIISYKEPKKQTVKELLKGSEFEKMNFGFYGDDYIEYSDDRIQDKRVIKLTQKQAEDIIGYKFEIVK